jgi:hypothetical protein
VTRDQIIDRLIENKIITYSEARDLRVYLPPDAPQEQMLAVIKGSYPNVRPRDVVRSLGISIADYNDIKATDVESYREEREHERMAERFREQAEAFSSRNRLTGENIVEEPQTWEGTEFENSREVFYFLRDEYNSLKKQGVFSVQEQEQLERFIGTKSLVQQDISAEEANDFVRQMSLAGADPEDLSTVRQQLPISYNFAMADDAEAAFLAKQPDYTGLRSLDPIQQAQVAAGADRIVDSSMSAGETSFLSDLQAEGIIPEGVTVETRSRLGYTGSGTVFDRATGQVISEDEWNLIKTNEAAAEVYRSKASVAQGVQSLLSSGKFTGTSQYQSKTVSAYNPRTGQYETRVTSVRDPGKLGLLPVEDLAIPTAAPTGAAWEGPTYDYKVGDGRAEWLGLSTRARAMRMKLMADSGLITHEQVEAMQGSWGSGGHPLNFLAMDIWEQAVSVSSEFQYSPLDAIQAIGTAKAAQEAATRRGRSGASAPTYSVPASLREIPDYKTLAQNTKQIFRGQLGREMEDWEVQLYADELKREHEEANRQRIDIHKQAWDEALAGGSTEVAFTAVEDPNTALDFDIEEAYADEIDRNVRVEDRANQNRLLMQSISVGQRMI